MATIRVLVMTLVLFVQLSDADVEIGGTGISCADDPACINRLHPDIPMAVRVAPGERITLRGRDASDIQLDPDEFSVAEASPREGFGVVHPLVGPVFIEGAIAGDTLAVTIEAIDPGPVGWTSA